MGSGKSRLGKRLAQKMQREFIDLDQYIEHETGKTISEIFAAEGEENFRKYEHKYLKELSVLSNHIIACGGGTPCYIDNKSLMKHTGVVIFLEVEFETLLARLWRNKNSRPLIAQFESMRDLASFISQLLEERTIFYKHAHMEYDNTYPKGNLQALVDALDILVKNKLEELS